MFIAALPNLRRRLRTAGRPAALALSALLAVTTAARAESIQLPPMPGNVAVDAGHVAFLVGHATGTQNYICLPAGSGYAYSLFTPEATLFSNRGRQLTTHFFSPNPDENATIRPTWQHSRDTSRVWGRLAANGSSSDPAFVEAGAIPWLKLEVAGTQEGFGGSDTLVKTTFIQRLNTRGGVAPVSGCSTVTDVGRKAFVPYEADYVFYRSATTGDALGEEAEAGR